jgi:hypothetical protein
MIILGFFCLRATKDAVSLVQAGPYTLISAFGF